MIAFSTQFTSQKSIKNRINPRTNTGIGVTQKYSNLTKIDILKVVECTITKKFLEQEECMLPLHPKCKKCRCHVIVALYKKG